MAIDKSQLTPVESADLEKALATFDEITKKQEMDSTIAHAFEKGASRMPGKFDVFVHPYYPFGKIAEGIIETSKYPTEVVNEWRNRYLEMILAALKANPEKSIVLLDTEKVMPDMDLPGIHTINSDLTAPEGFLTAQDMKGMLEYTKGINKDDEFKVHGSGWCFCAGQMPIQLFALTSLKIFFESYKPIQYSVGRRMEKCDPWHVTKLLAIADKYHWDQESKVRIGVQHNTAFVQEKHLAQSRRERFVDEGSIIIPTPEEIRAISK